VKEPIWYHQFPHIKLMLQTQHPHVGWFNHSNPSKLVVSWLGKTRPFLDGVLVMSSPMRTMFDGARCGGQVSITIQPASTPGGMQGVRVPRTGGDDRDFSMGISWEYHGT
jgi:hypothetical protein